MRSTSTPPTQKPGSNRARVPLPPGQRHAPEGNAACYNCERTNPIEPTGRQWCRGCNTRLDEVPQWVLETGWPTKPIPPRQRRRLHLRANVPVKTIRFVGNKAKAMAGTVEIMARREGLKMNDALLVVIEAGLEHIKGRCQA